MNKRPALISLVIVSLFFVLIGTLAVSQDNSTPVRPAKLDMMRNVGLDLSKSGFPAVLPREWGRLVSVERMDGNAFVMFLQNDAGEIYLVRLLQRGQYLFLDTYDQGGVALAIQRN